MFLEEVEMAEKEVELECSHDKTSPDPTERSGAGLAIRVVPHLGKGDFIHSYTHTNQA